MSKSKFIVDCSWEMYGHVVIEAEDVDEAISIAEQQTKLSDIASDYVSGSFEVDHDTTRVVSKTPMIKSLMLNMSKPFYKKTTA